MKKRVLTVVLAMLMAVLMFTPAFAIVEPTDDFYVADYANVLSSDTEQEIIRANGVLENTCNGAQLVVVAVEYLDGLYSDEYALQVMNDWGVGDANENNGMVLVFATKENKGWLATGDGIDSYFTDSMADDYLNRYFWDSFDKGQYDKAVNKLVSELTEWYEDHYDAGYGGNSYYDDPYYYNESYVDYSWIIIVVIFVAVFILVAVLGSRQHYRSYYVHMGMPIPRFHIWHMWSGPHRHWHDPHRHHHHHTYHHHHGGSGGFGGGRGGSGGFRSSGRGGGGGGRR